MAIKIKSDKLREIRMQRNLTRKEVASSLKWTEDKVLNVEEGRSGQTDTTIHYVEDLCDFYNIKRENVINYNFKHTKCIVLAAGKGGTGKTTTAAELIYQLSKNYDVLAIDGDPQGNLSKMLGFKEIKPNNLYKLITVPEEEIENIDISHFVNKTRLARVEAITFHPSMYAADKIINTRYVPLSIFKKIKESLVEQGKYDFVIIDTSPQVTTYTMGLYVISDKFYIPLDLAPFTIDSLPTFIETLNGAKNIKPSLWPGEEFKITGIIKTKADMRQLIAKEVSHYIDTKLPYDVISEIIPRTTVIEQAQYNSMFMEEFDAVGLNAKKLIKAYERIAKEVEKACR